MRHLFVILCLLAMVSCKQEKELKVLQLNIWQEGAMVPGGYDALVDELARIDADLVMFSEVRNYHGTRFCDRIVASLKEKGKTYYSFYSYDSGLLSKYPIKDSVAVFPENGDHGSVYKLVTDINGHKVCVYTAHLDYLNCSYYMVRGYHSSSFTKMEAPVTNIDSLMYDNELSHRDDAIRLFIDDASKEIADNSLVFIGGDFNEPSHLDWTEATKDSTDHHGITVPWTVSTLLAEASYEDAYRVKFPDPVTHPGYTYPSDNKGVDVSKLSWAPESDERERIDFIYYYPNPALQLVDAAVVGPQGSIRNNQRVEENTQDVFVQPVGVWPTDHKGVLATFKLK